jgi:hypothetical protein
MSLNKILPISRVCLYLFAAVTISLMAINARKERSYLLYPRKITGEKDTAFRIKGIIVYVSKKEFNDWLLYERLYKITLLLTIMCMLPNLYIRAQKKDGLPPVYKE